MTEDFANTIGRVVYLEDGSRISHSNIICIRAIQQYDYSHRDFAKTKPKKQYRYELLTLQGIWKMITKKDYEVIKLYTLKLHFPFFMVRKDIFNLDYVLIEPSVTYNTTGMIVRYGSGPNDFIRLSEYEYKLIKMRDKNYKLILDVTEEYEKSDLLLSLNNAIKTPAK